jgi:hypothetical protein
MVLITCYSAAVILQGAVSESEIVLSMTSKLFFFQVCVVWRLRFSDIILRQVFNVFLVTTVSGAVTQSLNQIIANPTSILTILGTAIPVVRTIVVLALQLAVRLIPPSSSRMHSSSSTTSFCLGLLHYPWNCLDWCLFC